MSNHISCKTTTFTVRVPNDLFDQINEIAPTAAKNRNELVLAAVREYLEKLVKA